MTDVLLPVRLAQVDAVRTPRHVDGALHERLVERNERALRTCRMPALSPSASPQRLAEHDRDVLDGVVGVDVDVALGLHGQVEQRVPGQRRQHVVVEPDARSRRRRGRARRGRARRGPSPPWSPARSAAVLAIRSPLRAVDADASRTSWPRTSVSAASNAAISLGVPIDTRSQPSGPTSRISTPLVQQTLPHAVPVVEGPEQHEVRVGVGHLEPLLAQPVHRLVALACAGRRRVASSSSACARATRATAWVTVDRW